MTLLEYQDKLVQTYGYKLLPDKIRWQVRRVFVIGQLKQQELERVGFQQLTLF